MMRLNLGAILHVTHAYLGAMVDTGWGRVITVVSDAGRRGERYQAIYGSAKAGAMEFMRDIAAEVGQHGVTANCLSLGTMRSGLTADAVDANPDLEHKLSKGYMIRRLGRPGDVAPPSRCGAATRASGSPDRCTRSTVATSRRGSGHRSGATRRPPRGSRTPSRSGRSGRLLVDGVCHTRRSGSRASTTRSRSTRKRCSRSRRSPDLHVGRDHAARRSRPRRARRPRRAAPARSRRAHRTRHRGDHRRAPAQSPGRLRRRPSVRRRFQQIDALGCAAPVRPGNGLLLQQRRFSIAGLVVESVSGSPFDGFVRERLLAPLGMKEACFRADDAITCRVALPHVVLATTAS